MRKCTLTLPCPVWGNFVKISLRTRTVLFWAITQRVVAIPYRRFRTTYRSHLQGPRNQLDSWPLKMEPIGCLETSVINYHYSLRNNPEERSSYILRGGSLKSRIFLGTFAKLQTATISSVMSVRPSACNSAPSGWILIQFDICGFSLNIYRKNSNIIKIWWHFTWRHLYICDISLNSS